MQPIPLTRRHHLQHYTTVLEANGFSTERLLDRMNMPMWQYGDPNDVIPLREVLSIISQSARLVGEETFGLHVGEQIPFVSSTPMGKLISASPTVYQAIKTACDIVNAQGHSSLAHFWLREAGDTIWWCRQQLPGLHDGLRQHEQYTMMGLISMVRLGAGPEWKPAQMWLCTPKQPGLDETDALADIHIRCGQPYSAFTIPKSVASMPIRPRGRPHTRTDTATIGEYMSTAVANDFLGSLRQLFPELLVQGRLQIECAADIARLPIRTLQCQLQREGTTFRKLVDEARYERATTLLEDPGATVTDIAFHLGYEHVGDFTRAFRRWTSVSPREYRRLTVN